MNVKLSIITPAYNAASVLDAAERHMLPQLTEVTEWIIVDDGSTDGTGTMLDEIAQHNPYVRVIHTENNGAGHARNLGIREARGEWVSFLDADDYYSDNSIEEMLNYLEKPYISQIDVVYTSKKVVDMDGGHEMITKPEHAAIGGIPAIEFWSSLYRREYLTGKHILFPEYREQDVETAFRILAFNETIRIDVTDDLMFYVHRDNPNSNVHTWNQERLYYVKACVYDELLARCFVSGKKVRRTITGILYSCIDQYLLLILKGRATVEVHNRSKRIQNIGIRRITESGSSKTWLKKMLYLALSVCTLPRMLMGGK